MTMIFFWGQMSLVPIVQSGKMPNVENADNKFSTTFVTA